jgi:toxin ParE1/3/4
VKIKFTRRARSEIREIYEYLVVESPKARLEFEARLSSVIQDARDFPDSGRSTDVRGVQFKNTIPFPYLVFYRASPRELVIVRVLHGARNPKSMPARPR